MSEIFSDYKYLYTLDVARCRFLSLVIIEIWYGKRYGSKHIEQIILLYPYQWQAIGGNHGTKHADIPRSGEGLAQG